MYPRMVPMALVVLVVLVALAVAEAEVTMIGLT